MTRFLLLVALLCVQHAAAQTSLTVIEPASLKTQFPNGIDSRAAAFGIPPYGHPIQGHAIYIPPSTSNACQSFTSANVPGWPNDATPVIALIDRGGCTFVTKTRNAANAGATAVIILNNRPGRTPYMADDGTGLDIHIPAVIVDKAAGDALRDTEHISLQLAWTTPSTENVAYSIWFTSFSDKSMNFTTDFAPVAASLRPNAVFTPKFQVLDGHNWHCNVPPYRCRKQCTNQGRYCAVDPEHNLNQGLDGADVVQENLRQMCLFKLLQAEGKGAAWWDYALLWQRTCAKERASSTEACSFGILQNLYAGITGDQITACITEAGGYGPNDGVNTMLAEMITEENQIGVVWVPFVVINGVQYRGAISCKPPYSATTCGPLHALCNAFLNQKYGEMPPACKNP